MPTGLEEPLILSDDVKVSGDTRWVRRNEIWHTVQAGIANDTAFASGVAITWDQETFDTSAFHDFVTNTSRLTAPLDGIYMVWAQIRTPTIINPEFYFKKNGSTIFSLFRKGGTIAGDVTHGFQTAQHFSVGDYVEVFITFDTDATRTVFHSPYSFFGMFRIG